MAKSKLASKSLAASEDERSESSSSEDNSKGKGSTTTGSQISSQNKDNTQTSSESSTLAKDETRKVQRSKMLVLFILACAAAGVAAATYIFVKNSEGREFRGKFHDFAIEMEALIHNEAKNVFLTVAHFSSTITAEALATKAIWPFFTVPYFEVRGLELDILANTLMMGFSPIVRDHNRERWNTYSVFHQDWIREGVEFNKELHVDFTWEVEHLQPIVPYIYGHLDSAREDENPAPHKEEGNGIYLPVWQIAPAPHSTHVINYNLLNNEVFDRIFHGMNETMHPVLSEATNLEFYYGGSVRDDVDHPHSFLLQPVFSDFNKEHRDWSHVVGTVIAILPWDHYFENILPPEAHGIYVVMKDTCGDEFTYVVNGAHATFVGYGDHHHREYSHLEEQTLFAPFEKLEFSEARTHCEYDLHIYPSWELESDFRTNHPIMYTFLVLAVFMGTTAVFILYDYLVTMRQNKVMLAAKKSNAVVASLFPRAVREQMLKDAEEQILAAEKSGQKHTFRLGIAPKAELKNFLDNGIAKANGIAFDTKPIADLFPRATIMYADIVGFTAWSSVREPTQVFQLLETVFHAFDEIAKRRRVFKVETVGDCYVAVSGLPEPRKDHASVIARFARDCMRAMNDLTKKLEVTLGPDTGELSMRIGMHSGPVTAGVLRGDKSRFQLFGDTMNTAARMEHSSARNKIHMSKETAELLKDAGKGHWVVPRLDKITDRCRGEIETFWLDLKKQSSSSHKSGGSSNTDGSYKLEMPHLNPLSNVAGTEVVVDGTLPAKIQRRVQWNVDVLLRLLKQVVARRNAEIQLFPEAFQNTGTKESYSDDTVKMQDDHTVLDEVVEIIHLPKYNPEAVKIEEDPNAIEISPVVILQLSEFVSVIASLYHHDNPFHNFEHASHVLMSVMKLLSRIVAPDEVLESTDSDAAKNKNLHDHTFGLTSDPLTQFACAFAALIHDVDHEGVPNAQLIAENAKIAAIYKAKSVAEQNSVDLSWKLLMDDSFKELRNAICATDKERKRFRCLVVNAVMATDICDKQLKDLRNARWEKAFEEKDGHIQSEREIKDDCDRKATIVIEHLIQASDVSHTMQHWHIYRKWNEAFFHENMQAFRAGRAAKDPCEYWYKGELGFFDFYIIPLAKKLKDCGVFGVSSDEYLNYAVSNRREWEMQGMEAVAQMAAKYLPDLKEGEDGEEDDEE